MTDQIKPCPFCGGTDIEIEGRGKVFRRDKGGLEPRYFVLRHVGKPEHIDEFDTCHVYIRARYREDLINYWSACTADRKDR